jgi:hypothetical protein
MPTVREILNELRTNPTVSVPNTGKVLGDLKPNASYEAAKDGTLGVPTFWIGGKIRCRSIEVLRVLGLEDEADFANAEQRAEAPAPQPTARKTRVTGDARKNQSKEKEHAIA